MAAYLDREVGVLDSYWWRAIWWRTMRWLTKKSWQIFDEIEQGSYGQQAEGTQRP